MGCLPLKWQRPRRGRLSCAGARFLFVFGVYTPCGRRISGVFGAFAGGPAPLVAERLPDADAAFRHGVADRSGVDGFIRVHLVRVFLRKALELALQLGVVGVDAGGGFFLVVEDLSEKNNYPSKSEEYMANQVFYQIFFG